MILAAGTFVSIVMLAAAGGVWYINSWYAGISRITIVHAAAPPDADPTSTTSSVPALLPAPLPEPATLAPATTEADLGPSKAVNVLLTGSDGRSCIDPSSPYAGAFLGNGNNIGTRADTIIVLHMDPAQHQLALLSFPRDLWVPIAGGTRRDRINSAFNAENPNPLIQTIESTFGIRIDHYIGVDFCAFKALVDAVGGISIPFDYPARDAHTGLSVTDAGCHNMNGDEALAYVRSRYYEHQVNGHWLDDGTSDYGRIARQQDFIRRLATRALATGATNPVTAKHLLDAARNANVRIDDNLSLTDLLRLARAVRDLDPQSATSYRVDGHGTTIGGADVILPDLTSPASKATLAVFRGLPPVGPPTSATSSPLPTTTSAVAATPATPADTTTTAASNMRGIYPPHDIACP